MTYFYKSEGPTERRSSRDKYVVTCQSSIGNTAMRNNYKKKLISFPESLLPFAGGRETRALASSGSNHFQACAIDEENLRLRSETGWAEFSYFKMVAPRALVFRPLVKGERRL